MADTTVKLDIRAPGAWGGSQPYTGPGVPAGWTESTGTTGYIYKFSGGNSGSDNGSWAFTHGSGQKQIEIQLITADGGNQYYITGVSIHYDDANAAHDLTPPDLAGSPARTCIITDSDVDVESGTFKVTCKYNDVTGIICDPRWDNN